jgi:hypothetical protein
MVMGSNLPSKMNFLQNPGNQGVREKQNENWGGRQKVSSLKP